MVAMRRSCPRCNNPLSKQRLAKRKKFCYSCEVANKREQKRNAHDRRVVATYGLRPGEYDLLLAAQGGRCPVKGCRANGATKFLAVEHDHNMPVDKANNRFAVRGLMCSMHNGWLGKANDDPEVFESIAEYLRNPPARKVLFPVSPKCVQDDDYDYTEGGMW